MGFKNSHENLTTWGLAAPFVAIASIPAAICCIGFGAFLDHVDNKRARERYEKALINNRKLTPQEIYDMEQRDKRFREMVLAMPQIRNAEMLAESPKGQRGPALRHLPDRWVHVYYTDHYYPSNSPLIVHGSKTEVVFHTGNDKTGLHDDERPIPAFGWCSGERFYNQLMNDIKKYGERNIKFYRLNCNAECMYTVDGGRSYVILSRF